MTLRVRRLLALAAVSLFALLAVAACGGGDDEPEATEPAATEPAETPATTEPAETTATEPGTTDGGTTEPGTTDGGTTGGGGAGAGDAAAGEAVWAEAGCGSCHALEAAGATGAVGPDLDELEPSMEAVVAQVTNGGGGMPAFGDTLSEQQILDVSAYVVESTSG